MNFSLLLCNEKAVHCFHTGPPLQFIRLQFITLTGHRITQRSNSHRYLLFLKINQPKSVLFILCELKSFNVIKLMIFPFIDLSKASSRSTYLSQTKAPVEAVLSTLIEQFLPCY